jgi:hypothetical protein
MLRREGITTTITIFGEGFGGKSKTETDVVTEFFS